MSDSVLNEVDTWVCDFQEIAGSTFRFQLGIWSGKIQVRSKLIESKSNQVYLKSLIYKLDFR